MANNKDDFAARLQRIQEKQGSQIKSGSKKSGKESGGGMGFGRRAVFIVLVVFGGLGLLAYGLTFGVGLKLVTDIQSVMSAQMEKISLSLPQNLEAKPRSDGRPGETGALYENSLYGGFVLSPAVLTQGNTKLSMTDIVEGFTGAEGVDMPKALATYRMSQTCNPRQPASGEKIQNISVGYGLSDAAVQVFSRPAVEAKMLKYLKGFNDKKGSRAPDINKFLVKGDIKKIDVLVTDTTAPIYLVLQAGGLGAGRLGVLWNVQAAPGVKIAHIALISQWATGLVPPNKNTSFERIPISGFSKEIWNNASYGRGESRDSGTDENPCEVAPQRLPSEGWLLWDKANRRDGVYRNQRNTLTEIATAYEKWFQQNLGVVAAENSIEAEAVSHILVGPVPLEKFAYRKISASTAYFQPADYAFFGNAARRAEKTLAIHQALLDEVLPEGIGSLRPGILEAEK